MIAGRTFGQKTFKLQLMMLQLRHVCCSLLEAHHERRAPWTTTYSPLESLVNVSGEIALAS